MGDDSGSVPGMMRLFLRRESGRIMMDIHRHSRMNYGRLLAMTAFTLIVTASTKNAMAQTVQHYKQTNLTSNQASLAPTVDPNLVNAWGLARSSTSPWWVADNGTGLSTLYGATGTPVALVVSIPGPNSSTPSGTPTGVVFNGDSTSFLVAPAAAASFIFVTEDGTIAGWNPSVNLHQAVIKVNNFDSSVYKGATIATVTDGKTTKTYLYVADFRKGKIAVFDSSFTPVTLSADNDGDHDRDDHGGSFEDERLPHGFAPFNVQNIGGNLYVAFAKQDSAKHDEVDGTGLGYVDVFSPRGRLLHRLEPGPWFNAPWGLTLASSDFGAYSHDVLVGQFGSGQILAFDPVTGKFRGALVGADDKTIHVDGLWALAFGNGASAGPATTLYFTAGPDNESNGLFGSFTAVENAQGNDQ
jgi:uncharacterized protein (TIGR03118 family)